SRHQVCHPLVLQNPLLSFARDCSCDTYALPPKSLDIDACTGFIVTHNVYFIQCFQHFRGFTADPNELIPEFDESDLYYV
ncbi:MAG: hypothetical protein FWD05_09030, partial [Oscillospiraceae bacterium]|nr:hypothetical protein [Oscillospiraceae bacterium]